MTLEQRLSQWQSLYQSFNDSREPVSNQTLNEIGQLALFYQQFKHYFQIHGAIPDLKLAKMFDLTPVNINGELYSREKLYSVWLERLPNVEPDSLGMVIATSVLNAVRRAKPHNLNKVESVTLKNIIRNLVGLSYKDQDYPLRIYSINKHLYILVIKNTIALLVEGTLDDLSVKAICLGSFITTLVNGRDLGEAKSMPWMLDFEQKLISMGEVHRRHTRMFKSSSSLVPELKGMEDHSEHHIPHHEWIIAASDVKLNRNVLFINRERWEEIKHFFI